MRHAVAFCSILIALLLGGCQPATVGTVSNAEPTVTIGVNCVEGGRGEGTLHWLKQIMPGIEAAVSTPAHRVHVRILEDGSDDDAFKSRLVLDLYGGRGPDIFGFDSLWTAEMASAGLVRPLDDELAHWPEWGLFLESVKKMGRYEGHDYLIPILTDVRGIYYRKDLFTRAGLTSEWTPRDWNDIFAAGEALRKLPGVTPIQWNAGSSYGEATTMQGFYLALLSAGGDLYNWQANRWVTGGASLRRALEFYRTIYVERGLGDARMQLDPKGRERSFERFRDGHVGMLAEGSYMWLDVLLPNTTWGIPNRNEVVGWAPMPGGGEPGDPTRVSISGGYGYTINKNSRHRDLAFAVLSRMLSRESQTALMHVSPFISARQDVLDGPEFKGDPELAREISTALPVTTFRPGFPLYPRVSELVTQMTEKVVQGVAVDTALAEYDRDVRALVGADAVTEDPGPLGAGGLPRLGASHKAGT
jgi:multiple sugar transport system substrate-binding protein